MQHLKIIFIALASVTLGTACRTPLTERPVKLVPGAEHVRLTLIPAEMAPCKRMGDIYPANMESPRVEFRNNVAGLGANAALVTAGTVKEPLQGVAYQCP